MNQILKEYVQFILQESKWNAIRKQLPGEPTSYHIHAWHATTTENWDGIKKKGLIPGAAKPAGQDWLGTWSGKGIYYHQTFPEHELDNSYDSETGEITNIIIEVNFKIFCGYVVPDEEFGEINDIEQIMKDKLPIAVAWPVKPKEFVAIHVVNTPHARDWVKENVNPRPGGTFKVRYHDV
jgi:hypothetical protein